MKYKKFKYELSAWNGSGRGEACLVLDEERRTIEVDILRGTDPEADKVIYFLLGDKDVRRMIKEYQQKGRERPYKIRSSRGMSCKEDYYINFYTEYGMQMSGKKLLHISCAGKLNEGFPKMYIGDFVELVSYMTDEICYAIGGCIKIYPPKISRKISDCRYVKAYWEEKLNFKATKLI